MSDLTDRLRDIDHDISLDDRYDAAARIEELEAENMLCRNALARISLSASCLNDAEQIADQALTATGPMKHEADYDQ